MSRRGLDLRAAARTFALLAAAGALVTVAWLGLQDSVGSWLPLVEVLALALAPALATLASGRWWVGLVVFAIGFIPAAGIATGVPLTDMRPGDQDFFGPVWGALEDGLKDSYEFRLPFSPADFPEAAGLVLIAIYGFTAFTGLLLAAERPLLAALVLVVGVGWPVTPGAAAGEVDGLRLGALVLGGILLILFLTRAERHPLRGLAQAAVLGAVVVLAAVGASTSGAVAKDAFLEWQRWDLYDAPKDPVGVRYVWSSNYRGITFPEKPTEVLRIKAPERSLYWRAATLDEYTGVGWREDLELGPPVRIAEIDDALTDPLLPEAARDRRRWIRQEVTVLALADTHLIGASQPVRWRPGNQGVVQYAEGGVVIAPQGLARGQRYTVWSYAPEVKPRALARVPARYPTDVVERYLEVVPGVVFPAFGEDARDETVSELFRLRADDALLARYEPLYRQAREVVGDTTSPYLAAASLEAWLRSEGGFRYEEQPSQPVGAVPPLVDFVLRSKEGYCQHFAGAMAVMLRLLGIPARVAVGFTSGSYDERRGEWTVTDHNAHAWVEVYFPGFGWLPFDPTPGRGELGASYSTASSAFPTGGAAALGISPEALTAILRQRLGGIEGRGAEGGPAVPGSGSLGGTDEGGTSIAVLVILVLAGAVAAFLGAKALRRALRFRSRDPRRVATACRRDLVAFLADQRITVSESTTLDEIGAFLAREYRVDPTPFVRAAAAARFGPPAEAEAAARRARRELKTLLGQLRERLGPRERARGAFRLRSFAV